MKSLIGIWFIALALCIVFFGILAELDTNEKITDIIVIMIVISCLEIGVYLLVY